MANALLVLVQVLRALNSTKTSAIVCAAGVAAALIALITMGVATIFFQPRIHYMAIALVYFHVVAGMFMITSYDILGATTDIAGLSVNVGTALFIFGNLGKKRSGPYFLLSKPSMLRSGIVIGLLVRETAFRVRFAMAS